VGTRPWEASMGTVRSPGPLTRLARRHGLVRSPLRRTTDRIEAALTATLAVLAVLILPVGATNALGNQQPERAGAAALGAWRTGATGRHAHGVPRSLHPQRGPAAHGPLRPLSPARDTRLGALAPRSRWGAQRSSPGRRDPPR